MLRRVAVLIASAVAVLAPAASAHSAALPDTETASSGTVAATFTHHDAGDGQWTGMDLTITRGGVQAFSGVAQTDYCPVPYCAPYGGFDDKPSLSVADVTGDAEPEVVVNLYTGGAHCCEIALVYRWTGNAYKPIDHDFADFGYTLQPAAPGGGPAAFVTGDSRFAYEFTSYADGAFPFKVYRIEDGAWSDQTLSYESGIVADAARWKKAYNKRRNGRRALGLLAAYVADEYLLGKRAAADKLLDHELKAGRLKSDKPWPGGKAYIKLLKKDLKQWGYVIRRGGQL
jgi:hypothetical protein